MRIPTVNAFTAQWVSLMVCDRQGQGHISRFWFATFVHIKEGVLEIEGSGWLVRYHKEGLITTNSTNVLVLDILNNWVICYRFTSIKVDFTFTDNSIKNTLCTTHKTL